jgi:hypothetical protein
MYALHQHIGGDEHLAVRIVKNGAVIAHAVLRRLVLAFQAIGETVDKTELSESCYLHIRKK